MDKILKIAYVALKYAALRIGVFLLVLATPVGILMSFNANADERQEQEVKYYEQSIGEKRLKLDEERRKALIQVQNTSVKFNDPGICNSDENSSLGCE